MGLVTMLMGFPLQATDFSKLHWSVTETESRFLNVHIVGVLQHVPALSAGRRQKKLITEPNNINLNINPDPPLLRKLDRIIVPRSQVQTPK